MSRITREEVERIADLARLSLSDEEARRMAEQLDTILDHVAELSALDTREIEPTAHVLPVATPLRPDAPEPALDPERAVAGAPEREGTAFRVPRVIGDEG